MFEKVMSKREYLEWVIKDDQENLAFIYEKKVTFRLKYQAWLANEPTNDSPGTEDDWFIKSFIRWNDLSQIVFDSVQNYKQQLAELQN